MASFKITILGSGTMVPTKRRNPAGFLVEADGKKILLDCGFGTIRRLADLGCALEDLDLVFISHFHTDHFGDAFPLIHSRWVNDIYKSKHNKPLLFLGPGSLAKRFKLWRKIFWVEPKENYPVYFKEGTVKIKTGKLTIRTFAVKHVPWFKSVGIIFSYKGKKIVYTGDIGSKHNFEELVKTVKGADLLITEAACEKPTPNHYTIAQVKELKSKSKVKKVLIVHVRPQHEKSIKAFCRREKGFVFQEDKSTVVI